MIMATYSYMVLLSMRSLRRNATSEIQKNRRLLSSIASNQFRKFTPYSNFKIQREISRNMSKSKYSVIQKGSLNSPDFRLYFRKDGGLISPFHDIPLRSSPSDSNLLNMIVEIPRWTNAKMEIATKEPLNPIKQDTKDGQLRYVANCFPYHGYIWNYGAFPETWEYPGHIDPHSGCKGDNDPIDVLELGEKIHPIGAIVQVKILGCFQLIDDGETDWKLLAVDVTDPLAPKLNDIGDIEKFMPGYLKATVEWFQMYKVPQGKPPNKFAFEGKPKDREFAMEILEQTRRFWEGLMTKKLKDASGLALGTTLELKSPFFIKKAEAEDILRANNDVGPEKKIDSLVHKSHFVKV